MIECEVLLLKVIYYMIDQQWYRIFSNLKIFLIQFKIESIEFVHIYFFYSLSSHHHLHLYPSQKGLYIQTIMGLRLLMTKFFKLWVLIIQNFGVILHQLTLMDWKPKLVCNKEENKLLSQLEQTTQVKSYFLAMVLKLLITHFSVVLKIIDVLVML